MPNCRKCNQKFPLCMTIDGKHHNFQNRKFCLQCSPFKQHNTKQLDKPIESTRDCPRCNHCLPLSEFYNRRNKPGSSVYCKRCTNEQTIKRQNKFKEICVAYKGGKCEICGYNRCVAALEFHHTDPHKKDFNISNKKLTTMDAKIKLELDKCKLYCAICHREFHWFEKHPRQDLNL